MVGRGKVGERVGSGEQYQNEYIVEGLWCSEFRTGDK